MTGDGDRTGASSLQKPGSGLSALLGTVRRYVAETPDVARFLGGALDGKLPLVPAEPRQLPVIAALPGCVAEAAPGTQALAQAVADAAPDARWSQTYTEAQVGAHFLANSGWFNLVSPDGPFVSPDVRVSVGYWAAGLVYPDHKHQPEEIYLVLSGAARFWRAGSAPELVEAGGTYRNPAWAIHGAAMEPGPLLAMAFWRGQGLNDRSVLTAPAPPPA